jgi:peptidoglycan/xylan/chitin deacetylase (PgdA/CDA1 family)
MPGDFMVGGDLGAGALTSGDPHATGTGRGGDRRAKDGAPQDQDQRSDQDRRTSCPPADWLGEPTPVAGGSHADILAERHMTSGTGPCQGCAERERLGRRRFLALLGTGTALALAGCNAATQALIHPVKRRAAATSDVPVAQPATVVSDPDGGPPLALGTIPPAHPGSPQLIFGGPASTRQIALTVDDGYCGGCIASYVEFAQQSGIHITFNPNGAFGSLWTPSVVGSVRQMIANKQVQIGNHTWDHPNLLTLSNASIQSELNRNEQWIQETFGITSRPYFRPPYGYYDSRVMSVAATMGYTKILMWNGTFGDATVETPQQIIGLAQQWLQPGTVMLGHLNHPAILSLFDQIQGIIASRNLEPVTLDEMFGTSRAAG